MHRIIVIPENSKNDINAKMRKHYDADSDAFRIPLYSTENPSSTPTHYWAGLSLTLEQKNNIFNMFKKEYEGQGVRMFNSERTSPTDVLSEMKLSRTPTAVIATDDFTVVSGIGETKQTVLNNAGIYTFADCLSTGANALAEIEGISLVDANALIAYASTQ